MTATCSPAPRRARARAEAQILTATIDLLDEAGFAGLTMEGVAERACVGKATLYRHWPSLSALVIDAIDSVLHAPELPCTGDLRADLVRLLTGLQSALATTAMGRVLPSLIEASRRDPELQVRFERFGAERRRTLEAILAAAIERGELPASTDVQTTVEQLVGPLFYRWLVLRSAPSATVPADIVATVLGGLAARDI